MNVIQAKMSMKQAACCFLHACFLLGLLFDPEDRGTGTFKTSTFADLQWTTRHFFCQIEITY
jgi:hypothetical protein